MKREYPGGKQKYSDGYRTEDKDRLTWNVALLSAFQVSSDSESGFGTRGAYLRYSLGFWEGVHAGYLVSPGDWINTVDLPEIAMLMRIDEQIFQFDRQGQQHEIRLCLYLAEAFRDQAKNGTLGQPLMVPLENRPGEFRYITMEELLNEAKVKINSKNLTHRFVPRIEDALQNLKDRKILARAEPQAQINREQGYWGKAWCNMPMIIQAPEHLVEEYHLFQPAQPPLIGSSGKGRKRPTKSKTS